MKSAVSCVPSTSMASRRVPKLSYDNCVQSSKNTFMCPKFHTNPVLKCRYAKPNVIFPQICRIFKRFVYYIARNYLPLLQQIADSLKKIGLVGTLDKWHF